MLHIADIMGVVLKSPEDTRALYNICKSRIRVKM